MQNTAAFLFLITAAIILVIKRIAIKNIDSNFAISEQISDAFSVYKRLFSYIKYKATNKTKTSFADWSASCKK